MKNHKYQPLRYRSRWFCYLDLLGFTALVNDESIRRVIPLYKDALHELERFAGPKKRDGVLHGWFSDTFIIYSKNDSEADFAYVEHVSRLFFQKLVLGGVPVRGAITHGNLYSQSRQNLFIGPALIDAYKYGEGQDWLGLILTPRVHEKLKRSSLALEHRAHYRLVSDPKIIKVEPATPIYAFAFNNLTMNGKNPYIVALRKMKEEAPAVVAHKYDNAIEFARKYGSSQRSKSDSA